MPASQKEGLKEVALPPSAWARLRWPMVAVLVVVAGALRLREAAKPIMGAEDPYRHMERAWDLAQGLGLGDYPPGITMLLAPLTLLGPATFYVATRYLPVLFGISLVVGLNELARRHTHPAGAFTAAFLAAVIPETIRRTDLMFPTAIDLALLPWFLLVVLRASEGSRRAFAVGAAFLAVFAMSHPWLVFLLTPPVAVFAFVLMARRPGRPRLVATVVGLALAGLFAFAVARGAVLRFDLSFAVARGKELILHPSTLTPLPVLVDLPAMLSWPALVLGAFGAVCACVWRTRYGLLALLWAGLLLPLCLVDWLDVWYIPHRTVVYFAIGLCMLAALPVSALAKALAGLPQPRRLGIVAGAVALVALVTLPSAVAMQPWYRIYTQDDRDAWAAIDGMDPPLVVAGSWQGRMGYRATTGNLALYNPSFFTEQSVRDYDTNRTPGLIVLVDVPTRASGLPLGFLSSWEEVGRWGNVSAYTRS